MLIIAVMYPDKEEYQKAKSILIEKFGEIKAESQPYNFDQFTSYYEKEMGKNLVKTFIVFNKEIEKRDLIKIKKQTTEIEKEFAVNNNRIINLDPGYLNKKELVLASFKKGTNYKEDLGEGVYAHKVLEFKDKLLDSKNPKGFRSKASKPLEKQSFSISLGNSKDFQKQAIIFWHTFPDYRVEENQEFFVDNLS